MGWVEIVVVAVAVAVVFRLLGALDAFVQGYKVRALAEAALMARNAITRREAEEGE